MKIVINLILLYFIAAFFIGWPPFSKQWTAFVYEEQSIAQEPIEIGPFKDYAACRESALSELDRQQWQDGYFECGLNCRHDPGTDLNLCAETRND